METNIIKAPNANEHLDLFMDNLKNKIPFSFVRFSDGETEILRNRYLEINAGKTVFRGKVFKNNFPDFDSKKFVPHLHQNIRKDLLDSALYKNISFYKGIPTSHNKAYKDKDFMLRLNGGFDYNITFSDLFLNSNYKRYKSEVVPLFESFENIYIIANYRAKPTGILSKAKHISVPDNFFSTYDETLEQVLKEISNIEIGSLVLSSASSLSNIIAYKVSLNRTDITFLDVGTSINELLSMDTMIRSYHKQKKGFFKRLFYKKSKSYEIKW